jgi:hypothetical protein
VWGGGESLGGQAGPGEQAQRLACEGQAGEGSGMVPAGGSLEHRNAAANDAGNVLVRRRYVIIRALGKMVGWWVGRRGK